MKVAVYKGHAVQELRFFLPNLDEKQEASDRMFIGYAELPEVQTKINVGEGVFDAWNKAKQMMVEKSKDVMMPKPPIGVKPRKLVDEERLEELERAIEMYKKSMVPVPQDWYNEWNEIALRLMPGKQKKVVTKEIPIPPKNFPNIYCRGEALFFVPANAKNVRCLYDVEE